MSADRPRTVADLVDQVEQVRTIGTDTCRVRITLHPTRDEWAAISAELAASGGVATMKPPNDPPDGAPSLAPDAVFMGHSVYVSDDVRPIVCFYFESEMCGRCGRILAGVPHVCEPAVVAAILGYPRT